MSEKSEQVTRSTKRFSRVRVLQGLAHLLTLGLIAASLASFGARSHWVLDLFTHFPVQMMCAATASILILLATRDLKGALVPAAILAIYAWQVSMLYMPMEQPKAVGDELCVVSANVYTGNTNTKAVIDFIHETEPDILLLMEVDNRWTDELIEIRADYPHSLQRPREDNFGISLFSRWPINSARVEYLDAAQLPTLVVEVQIGDRTLNVIGTHPLPPVSESNSTLRNDHLVKLAELVLDIDKPVVVIGDLNTTSWSPHFRDLMAASELKDSRQGFGIQPTWPFSFWPFRIPIDHALVSGDIHVTGRKVGPDIGSDHRPIVLRMRLSDSS